MTKIGFRDLVQIITFASEYRRLGHPSGIWRRIVMYIKALSFSGTGTRDVCELLAMRELMSLPLTRTWYRTTAMITIEYHTINGQRPSARPVLSAFSPSSR